MDVSHAGFLLVCGPAYDRLHEVQNVLNTTQMTTEVISKALADFERGEGDTIGECFKSGDESD